MKPSEQVQSLVGQMPDADDRGMYTKGIDAARIDAAIDQLARGGRDSLLGVIDMLVQPGDGEDYKARYALHCLAIHACKAADGGPRREFGEALASQLGGDRPAGVQKYLIEQLQVAAGPEVAGKLRELLKHEELGTPAAMALEAIGA
ncbi:MAG: hypothetical protein U1E05_25880 [Patescibacteria group bacterium]|nr:hypothetical protein [Patescibacteria group bacterium]